MKRSIEVMIEKKNSDLDEKLSRFSKIESRIYDKYINKMSSKVNKLLDEKISTDCGLIHIKNKNAIFPLIELQMFYAKFINITHSKPPCTVCCRVPR